MRVCWPSQPAPHACCWRKGTQGWLGSVGAESATSGNLRRKQVPWGTHQQRALQKACPLPPFTHLGQPKAGAARQRAQQCPLPPVVTHLNQPKAGT